MIISHKYKFIFFAIPKTATHAIRFALRPYLHSLDEEHVHMYKPSKLNIAEFQARKNGHFSVEEIKPYLSTSLWKDYFKFSFVRNPWDRFISMSFFHYKALQRNSAAAQQLLLELAKLPEHKLPKQYRSQSTYLYAQDGSCPIDYIGKFENLQNDFNVICEKIGLPKSDLQRVNSSKHDDYLNYYQSNNLAQRIRKKYASDIINFEYSLKGLIEPDLSSNSSIEYKTNGTRNL